MIKSKRFPSILLAGVLAAGVLSPVLADDAPAGKTVTFTVPGAAFDDAIRDFLKRNPEVVMQALQDAQVKQQEMQKQAAKAAITTEAAKLYNDPASPVAGNSNGKETIVEFFDYQCHYCKQIHPDLVTLLKTDPDLKIIFKDFPILGPGSALAAKAALAARMQDKYLPMHDALLEYKGQFDDESLKQLAEKTGVDYDRMKADMEKPEIQAQINDNLMLAQKLDVHGTPSMIINHQFVDGALPLDELKKHLADHSAE
jgi:protein-disulfide isomerase